MHALRITALTLGFLFLGTVATGMLAIGLRAVWIKWVDQVPEPTHWEEKQNYLASVPKVDPATAPNFVVIFFDDLGDGDLSSYGNPLIETPQTDRAAAEGIRFTEFYSASSACTPSRASLLTGRYPPRAGVATHVYFPSESIIGWARELQDCVGASNKSMKAVSAFQRSPGGPGKSRQGRSLEPWR